MRAATFLTVAIATVLINTAYATRAAELNKRLGEDLPLVSTLGNGIAGGPAGVVESAVNGVIGGSNQQPNEKRGVLGGGLPLVGGLPIVGGLLGGDLLGGGDPRPRCGHNIGRRGRKGRKERCHGKSTE